MYTNVKEPVGRLGRAYWTILYNTIYNRLYFKRVACDSNKTDGPVALWPCCLKTMDNSPLAASTKYNNILAINATVRKQKKEEKDHFLVTVAQRICYPRQSIPLTPFRALHVSTSHWYELSKSHITKQNYGHSLQSHAQKNTSRTKYPFWSTIIPATWEITASPRFWIDCMLKCKWKMGMIQSHNVFQKLNSSKSHRHWFSKGMHYWHDR